MTAATWEVQSPPPAPEGASANGEIPPASASPTPPVVGPLDWTEADVETLKKILRGPYDSVAKTTGDDAYLLTPFDELALVTTLKSWLPVAWVRSGPDGRLPLMLALPFTAVVLAAVNLPKLAHWNARHPDARIEIPIPFTKFRVGGASGGAARQAAPSGDAAGDGGRDQRAGGTADLGEAPGTTPAAASAAGGARDGGPAADSPDDIRRSYAGG